MNTELIKFIELCLTDGVISDKEREVIFRKAKELDVPEDECEIILEGMLSKALNQGFKEEANIKPTERLESEKIYALDIDFCDSLNTISQKLSSELSLITKESFKESFIKWVGRLNNEIIHKKWSNNSSCYHLKSPRRGTGRMFHFDEYGGKRSDIIGELYKYCLTETELIEYEVEYRTKWFSAPDRIYTYGQVIKLNEIDFWNDYNYRNALKPILWAFCENVAPRINSLEELKLIRFNYDSNPTICLIDKLKKDKVKTITKVLLEIEKISTQFNDVLETLNSDDLVLYPWGKNNGDFGINQSFIETINLIEAFIKSLIAVISIKNELIISAFSNDEVRYEYLRNKLDNSGLLMNYFESQSLSKSEALIHTLNEGFNSINGVLSEISSGINNLNQGLTTGLNELNENVRMNNILQGIQSYQLYRLNKS